jgi:hypothetical protein
VPPQKDLKVTTKMLVTVPLPKHFSKECHF